MKTPALFVLFLGFLTSIIPLAAEEPRTWTDREGRAFVGELLEHKDGVAKIRAKNGRVYEINVQRLSDGDREYLEQAPAAPREDLSAILGEIIQGGEAPSLAAAAVVDGEIVAAGAAGKRKRGEPEEVTIDDMYHIGSCGKSMTATLAAVLVAEGKLGWETTLGEVFGTRDVHKHLRGATLRQLLTHRAGFAEDRNPSEWKEEWRKELWRDAWENPGTPRKQRERLVEELLKHPPKYPPGTDSEYSNWGYTVAGAMMEEVIDTAFEELIADKLFKPLGMASAGFRAPATPGKVDQPYGHSPDPVEPEPSGDNPRALAPAGTIHCSIVDFAKYARFHLSDEALGELTAEARGILYESVGNDGKAMGWIVAERSWANGTALTHTGTNNSFYAVIWLAPEREFAAVAATNSGTPAGFSVCDAAIGKLIEGYVFGK